MQSMKLLIEKYQYQSIDRDSVDGKRLYSCPDGSRVPSVTTILSATQSKEKAASLQKWRDGVGHTKAAAITTEAANRGTRMHKWLEDYVIDGFLKKPGTNPYSVQSNSMAKTIINEGLRNVNEIWGSEIGLYYPELYAGTTDLVGVWKNKPAIMDFKQSNKIKKEEHIEDYYLQLTAYSICHNKIYNTDIRTGVVLICVKPPEISPMKWGEPQYQEFVLEGSNYDKYVELWWDKVHQYYRNN
jgi:hypothetical protein